MATKHVALVERVYHTPGGRHVEVICPFRCPQAVHQHHWGREPRPSAEVLASCAPVGELRTYAIDPQTAAAADADCTAREARRRHRRDGGR